VTFFERLIESLQRILQFVPGMFLAALVFAVGFFIAKLAQRGVGSILRRAHLNDVLRRGGIPVRDQSGAPVNPTRVVANLVFWIVLFVALLVAADALGINYLGDVFSELVSYVPSVIAAIVIVVLGIVLGDFVSALIHVSTPRLDGGPMLARAGKGGVILLAVFMSLQELGIATDIVTTAFAIIFGAIALALSLAFGLGNRDLAGQVTRAWYERWQAERDAIERQNAEDDEGPSAPTPGA